MTVATDDKATRHLVEVFLLNKYINREMWRECFPYVFKVLENSKELDIKARFTLLLCVRRCLKRDGRTMEAIKSLEEASQWANGHLAEDYYERLLL